MALLSERGRELQAEAHHVRQLGLLARQVLAAGRHDRGTVGLGRHHAAPRWACPIRSRLRNANRSATSLSRSISSARCTSLPAPSLSAACILALSCSMRAVRVFHGSGARAGGCRLPAASSARSTWRRYPGAFSTLGAPSNRPTPCSSSAVVGLTCWMTCSSCPHSAGEKRFCRLSNSTLGTSAALLLLSS